MPTHQVDTVKANRRNRYKNHLLSFQYEAK